MAGKFVGDREVNGTHGTRRKKKKSQAFGGTQDEKERGVTKARSSG